MRWGVIEASEKIGAADAESVSIDELWSQPPLWKSKVREFLSLGFTGVVLKQGEEKVKGPEAQRAFSLARECGLEVAVSITAKTLPDSVCSQPDAIFWRSLCMEKEVFAFGEQLEITCEERLEKEVAHFVSRFPGKKILLDLTNLDSSMSWLYKALELLPSRVYPIVSPYNEKGKLHSYIRNKPVLEKSCTPILFSLDRQGVLPPLFYLLHLAKMENLFLESGELPNSSFLLPIPTQASPLSAAVVLGVNNYQKQAGSLRSCIAFALQSEGIALAEWESFPGYCLLLGAVGIYQTLSDSSLFSYEEKKERFFLCYSQLEQSISLWEKEGIVEWVEAVKQVQNHLVMAAKRESISLGNTSSSLITPSFPWNR